MFLIVYRLCNIGYYVKNSVLFSPVDIGKITKKYYYVVWQLALQRHLTGLKLKKNAEQLETESMT